jgi:hypothetical protein
MPRGYSQETHRNPAPARSGLVATDHYPLRRAGGARIYRPANKLGLRPPLKGKL